jgi:hypothetical protein
VPEKRKGEAGVARHAPQTGTEFGFDQVEVVGAEIGQFPSLDVPPHEFGGVEIRRVPRQAFHDQPMPLTRQVPLHLMALVRRQAVPDQGDAPPADVALEVLQEADERGPVVTAGPGLEEELTAATVPPECQGRGDGQFLPVERVDQDGGFAPRCPGAPDRGALRDPTLVLEDEPGAPAASVFFTVGQRTSTQC